VLRLVSIGPVIEVTCPVSLISASPNSLGLACAGLTMEGPLSVARLVSCSSPRMSFSGNSGYSRQARLAAGFGPTSNCCPLLVASPIG